MGRDALTWGSENSYDHPYDDMPANRPAPVREWSTFLQLLVPEWMSDAACKGMDQTLFFPPKGGDMRASTAVKAICESCPVRVECLDFALDTGIKFGVWGGTSERDRRRIRRQRARGLRSA